jgi:FKBP-type peptidyl-prolyl cis-trans isomerase SlyD
MDTPTIGDGKVVQFHYVLGDEHGTVLDSSRDRDTPMIYLHGAGNLVRGLEEALTGHAVGDQLRVEVPPERGYGLRKGGPQPVPRSIFPSDAPLVPGDSFTTKTPDGRPMMLWITRVEGDQVWVDPHHPLAGKTLRYAVEIVSIRKASPKEVRQGHPNAPVSFDA